MVAGSHTNNKYDDDFVFIYFLDFDGDCEVKWIKTSEQFDLVLDIAFESESSIVALAEKNFQEDSVFEMYILIINNLS